MPKVPAYTLAWSPPREAYELYKTRDRGVLRIVPDSPAWFTWLDQVSSFAFVGKSGHYTARKEVKQRGDRYWYAYLATGEQLTKKYLGKTADLSLARLEHIAGMLHAQSETHIPPPISLAARTDSEYDAIQRPLLTQLDTPLHPLLATKLYAPRPRAQLVHRAHLIERLQQGMAGPLTLISAPAGFGKTTLLAQWFAQSDLPVAWLSLEAEVNDPAHFLSYLIAALQTLDAQLGTTALALLRTSQPSSPETVLATLISDLTSRSAADFALVLDDYHIITAESIQRGMTFLLEHLPAQLHLILASRADPPLPLARLRVQGQLTEVRTADLLSSTVEANTFLQEVMGLNLPPEAIATLDRLSGPLCDAVTHQGGSQAMLVALERANLFVVALDEERNWYRYHHLFAEALRCLLQKSQPSLLPALQRSASLWYEQHARNRSCPSRAGRFRFRACCRLDRTVWLSIRVTRAAPHGPRMAQAAS